MNFVGKGSSPHPLSLATIVLEKLTFLEGSKQVQDKTWP